MTSENFIHVGFQYEEAITAKRDLLSLEMGLLEAVKSVTNYHSLRSEELKLKLKLYLRTKEYLNLIKKLKKVLPKYKLPKILKDIEKETIDIDKIKEEQEIKYGEDVDSELEKIQSKLRALQ
ncbi:MAG: hypothetical protein ABFQ65_04615 [Nanoarchaeota archaeon]